MIRRYYVAVNQHNSIGNSWGIYDSEENTLSPSVTATEKYCFRYVNAWNNGQTPTTYRGDTFLPRHIRFVDVSNYEASEYKVILEDERYE